MYENVWKQRNEEAMEVDYQKDLRVKRSVMHIVNNKINC